MPLFHSTKVNYSVPPVYDVLPKRLGMIRWYAVTASTEQFVHHKLKGLNIINSTKVGHGHEWISAMYAVADSYYTSFV